MENTGVEKDVSSLGTIVSKTDLNGTITEVNTAFIEASGYSRSELIGQPHNILRHPDVPKEVFKDLWATMKSGKPWVQIVKNLCKDGSYYWVEANMTPILEEGKIVGFISVRRPIDDKTKKKAEQAYQEIRQGRKQIKNGNLVGPLERFCTFHVIHPINLMVGMIAILGIGASLIQAGVIDIPVGWVAAVSVAFYLYAWAGRKYAFKRLGRAKQTMDMMRQGDFSGQVDFLGNHSLSKLVAAVKMMQVQLGAMYDDAYEKLNRSTRLKSALDSASSQVMMVDNRGSILYLNDALQEFFDAHESKLQSVYPEFRVEHLLGSQLCTVFSDKDSFTDLSRSQDLEECFADFIFDIKIRPVYNDEDIQIGTVIEWLDLTQQKSVEQTLQMTLQMASLGHTDLHLDTTNLKGFFLDTSNSINQLFASLNEIIEDMVFVMNNLATGDIRGRVEKDLQGSLAAMKGATNVSLNNLSSIIWYIKKASDTVGQAATESTKASLDLSSRTQQAAATLEQINATMQSVNQLQIENSNELSGVSHLTEQAVSENDKAKGALLSTITAMEDIQDTSDKISNIIGLIDGIAFQTNLLALNAAVEAARAGEHGRGFAVVAGEVRSLAQKSAEAAQDIKKLIDESSVKVKQGVEKVQETEHAFTVVNEGVTQIGQSLSEVVRSITEQQQSVAEVSQAIQALDANIQNNATLVEETSAASESLQQQAELLMVETNKFQINESYTETLIQKTPDIHGVRVANVRQEMRIWLTNVQSFLNGVNVSIDMETAKNPAASSVGTALASIVSIEPSIQQMSEFKQVEELHQQQHKLIADVMQLREKSSDMNFDDMKLRDRMMDEFVDVSNALDKALDEFNEAYFRTH
ncbi:methyl-accepting chemotaxis protein [Thiomicrorhabdus sp. ZW0627]|uniref:methyl-accepting chemotaxis protein n=1 Tax=Thiomicrorhabdus sp. ZW0627 TaxID=3039774 RepID=UPI00243638DF|nr:methyl-accepting chemotaxis protein [Thiomicrorhabdus sp. ZW0627]MDG6774728.1 methyl-accepting chemotaxis protein [Thiomicrorhabdus sp. ZW0627]